LAIAIRKRKLPGEEISINRSSRNINDTSRLGSKKRLSAANKPSWRNNLRGVRASLASRYTYFIVLLVEAIQDVYFSPILQTETL
tara:strand:+ start:415 stop:669 length:255 start_codon:yes stop_codon:yes gene_type:complete